MAGNTAHIVFRMYGIQRIHVLRAAGMAGHAAFVDLFGGSALESEDFGYVTATSDVSGTGPVARFTALMRRAFFRIERGLPVSRFFPVTENLVVAGFTRFRADVGGSGLIGRRAGRVGRGG